MARYVAFLRGVSPMNARMPELKQAFETGGFTNVRTLLSSGNVVFDARAAAIDQLQRRAEAAMRAGLDRSFDTIVRPVLALQQLIASDPFAAFDLGPSHKRIVTFLRQPADAQFALPPERDGARILKVCGGEVLSAYLPNDKGPVFMSLLERSFGKTITTRTFDTVRKCAQA
ncbi:DUF1697 domain-containing protein [Rhizobacter sp. Root404]|jgi:uncharacterized protein (DUF1697 family)|uniref:DUF1697 domain-containing protein n=1 Tax=Rhizobacter sp. Root404 TaxID=1736528 RepID=UPI0006F827A7|nr:DUF1697 domain-containing protein [Rhizobacter sp. Root404]KQW37834.1 hypothetical protein ASC76_07055 [Rhizobacter sp. Root404]